MFSRTLLSILFVVVFIDAQFAHAQSNVITLESQVKGNQEQPNVLSIVPWKTANDRTPIERSVEADIGRLFQHLDKQEFARQHTFYSRFRESESKAFESKASNN